MHLVVTSALSSAPGCLHGASGLRLPHLEQLLERLQPTGVDAGAASSWSTPAERVLAKAVGLPSEDGRIPWAAWELARSGRDPGDRAWAHVTPVHLDVAAHHISMGLVHQLQLQPQESHALLQSLRPYFEEDGITLESLAPERWLASGALFRDMASASLDRVSGGDIDPWIPRASQAGALRRLQSEMQMLLYTHPINEVRIAAGLPVVNSFWVSGCGAAAIEPGAASRAAQTVVDASQLRDSALEGDWAAWCQAWQGIDALHCAQLLACLHAGQPATLSLCGQRNALRFGPGLRPAGHRWLQRLRHRGLQALHDQL